MPDARSLESGCLHGYRRRTSRATNLERRIGSSVICALSKDMGVVPQEQRTRRAEYETLAESEHA